MGYEYCSECNNEVILPDVLGAYECPKCGKRVVHCAMCDRIRNPVIDSPCHGCKFTEVK